MGSQTLEEKAVKVRIGKVMKDIVEVKGSVIWVEGFNEPFEIMLKPGTMIVDDHLPRVTGYQKKLHIALDSETSTYGIGLLKFMGTSPVRRGDNITAGLILGENVEKSGEGEALYVSMWGDDEFLIRRDYMDGYDPLHNEAKRLGLT